jgi:hypothetical protein
VGACFLNLAAHLFKPRIDLLTEFFHLVADGSNAFVGFESELFDLFFGALVNRPYLFLQLALPPRRASFVLSLRLLYAPLHLLEFLLPLLKPRLHARRLTDVSLRSPQVAARGA